MEAMKKNQLDEAINELTSIKNVLEMFITNPYKMPQLEVNIIKATNLPKMDVGIGAKSDPYVVLKLGKTKHQTTVKKKTLDPIYNEKFVFTFDEVGQKAKLKIQMFDHDTLTKHDKMGKVTLLLNGLKKGVVTKHSVKIGPKGYLLLEMTALDFGLDESVPEIKPKYLYFHTPVDEQGNNDSIEEDGIESEEFDTQLKNNYLDWEIVTSENVLTFFLRAYLYQGSWFRVMQGEDDNYYYFKSVGKNEEGLEEYDPATKEEISKLDKEIDQWKDVDFVDPTTNEKTTLFFITEFLDIATGKYYAVYSDKQY